LAEAEHGDDETFTIQNKICRGTSVDDTKMMRAVMLRALRGDAASDVAAGASHDTD
jgi:hypothetical protein